jgi:hypothetical protein
MLIEREPIERKFIERKFIEGYLIKRKPVDRSRSDDLLPIVGLIAEEVEVVKNSQDLAPRIRRRPRSLQDFPGDARAEEREYKRAHAY